MHAASAQLLLMKPRKPTEAQKRYFGTLYNPGTMPSLVFQHRLEITQWILRIAVFGTFAGHGVYACLRKPEWLPFLTFWGIPEALAYKLMLAIGMMDLLIAFTTLLRPIRALLIYATLWALAAAAMRPILGESILQLLERLPNGLAPLALYMLYRAQDARK